MLDDRIQCGYAGFPNDRGEGAGLASFRKGWIATKGNEDGRD